MDIFERKYWVEVIARLVRRDYRPEPTVSQSTHPLLADDDIIEEPKLTNRLHSMVNANIIHFKKGLSFSEMLFKFINDKDIDQVKLYQHVMVSRSVFSKIRSSDTYQPDKDTVFKFAIGLRLNLEEGITFLASAGFNFKLSSNRDLIIRHCLELAKFDLIMVDQLLVDFKEKPLFSEK
jgi:hypothetical protein